MTTATINISDAALFEALQLAHKFKGEEFPLTLADLEPAQLTALANSYASVLVQRSQTTEPLGRQLSRVANAQIDAVVDTVNAPGDEVVTFNSNTAFVKGDGTLLTGKGNPNGKLAVVSNGKIELALGARLFDNLTLPTPTDGSYAITVATGADWTVVFSAGLLEGTTNNITALYDVELTMFGDSTGLETGAKAVFKLVRVGERYEWHITGFDPVVDSATNDKKSVSQNIQRLSFYGTVVHPAIPAGSVPLGTFKVRLKATHRKTSEVLTNDITVVATAAV